LRRIERDTARICAVLAAGALAAWPAHPRVAGGVVGGALLIAFSYATIKGLVDARLRRAPGAPGVEGVSGPPPARRHLVKFFTRHAILALAAYVMMALLRLDPVAMLAGASALLVAVGIEAARGARRG
jgi:hypothetical protein